MKPRSFRAGVLAVVALGILGFGGQSLARLWNMKHEVDGLEKEIATLRTETSQLSTVVSKLQSDPEALERAAREELGMVRPGERVLALPKGASSGGR